MTLNINIFKILDQIREDNAVSLKDWAEASRLPQSRISELRRIADMTPNADPETTGRVFSLPKCQSLLKGLIETIGGEMTRKELLKKLKDVTDRQERLVIMVLALSTDQEEQADLYLSALLKTNEK